MPFSTCPADLRAENERVRDDVAQVDGDADIRFLIGETHAVREIERSGNVHEAGGLHRDVEQLIADDVLGEIAPFLVGNLSRETTGENEGAALTEQRHVAGPPLRVDRDVRIRKHVWCTRSVVHRRAGDGTQGETELVAGIHEQIQIERQFGVIRSRAISCGGHLSETDPAGGVPAA